MGAAMDKCCASERDRGRQAQAELARRVRFDGEDASMSSLEKVQVLRRASRTPAGAATESSKSAPAAPETEPKAPEVSAQAAAAEVQAAQARSSAARQKGARLLKAGIKTGEVSKLVDAKEAEEEAAKAAKAPAAPTPEEDLYEF
eukprot:g13957.t1